MRNLVSPSVELVFPHGTVSAVIDYDVGLMRIFAEPEDSRHPADWRQVTEMAAEIAGGGWDFWTEGGTDVFDVRIRPVAQLSLIA